MSKEVYDELSRINNVGFAKKEDEYEWVFGWNEASS